MHDDELAFRSRGANSSIVARMRQLIVRPHAASRGRNADLQEPRVLIKVPALNVNQAIYDPEEFTILQLKGLAGWSMTREFPKKCTGSEISNSPPTCYRRVRNLRAGWLSPAMIH